MLVVRRALCGIFALCLPLSCGGKSTTNALHDDGGASASSGGSVGGRGAAQGGRIDEGASGGAPATPPGDSDARSDGGAGADSNAGAGGQPAPEEAGGRGEAGEGGEAGQVTVPPSCNPIVFADPVFEHAVHDAIAHHQTPESPPGQLTSAEVANVLVIQAESYGVTSLSGIECIPSLQYLGLGLNGAPLNQVSDLTPLAGLKALRSLDLAQNPVADLAPLAGLERLEFLDVQQSNLVDADLTPLGKLRHLRELRLNADSVLDLTPLGKITDLRVVELNQGTIRNPASASTLTQVTALWLDGAMPSAAPLAGLTQLSYLGLSGNGLSDISALGGLTNLTVLSLDDNAVVDISALAGMKQLGYLGLQNNRVTDLSTLSGLDVLSLINVTFNRVTTLGPLANNLGLGLGDTVWADGNLLDCAAEAAHIQALEARSVSLVTDCR